MKRVLIIGASGFIGKAFWEYYHKKSANPLGTSHRPLPPFLHLDLLQPNLESLSWNPSEFSHGIIAAGTPKLSECEKNFDATYSCNVTGIVTIAKQLLKMGIQPIILSSDYVFDGHIGGYKETDPLNPLNHYGRQKQMVERLIQEACDRFLIVRLGKVFACEGKSGKTLVDELIGQLKRKEVIFAAKDQILTPIHIDDLLFSVDCLLQKNAQGIFHVCSTQKISRYDLACEIASAFKTNLNLIRPVSLDDLQESFLRPKKTDMSCEKLIKYIGYEPRSVSWFLGHLTSVPTL